MANSSVTLSSLDFDTLKNSFIEYLKSQDVFKDYNYDGSNMSVLLDLLSYNTHLNAFYLNMIASEMFLDSAQKYDSVISHAKELNYVPISAAASTANVSFTVTDEAGTLQGKFVIPKGTKFYGTNSNNSFDFVTKQDNVYLSANTTYQIDNLQLFEGIYLQDSFVINYQLENQRYVISNQNVDINTIEVLVIENNGANNTIFSRSDNLFNIDSRSNVFFLQGCENNKYEIVFGDGLFGRKPLNNATVQVKYLVTNGSKGNGVDSFTLSDNIGSGILNTSIVTITKSVNGADQENIDSIKYKAPRYFATQQRAVSSDDYASLIMSRFGGQIDDVIIYGGQELEPKQYGRVVVSLKPVNSVITPEYLKKEISNYLIDYIALPNRVLISDPEYFYIEVNSTVQYTRTAITKSETDLKNDIIAAMLQFATDHIEKFGDDFRYSKFVSHIDNVDTSITSNNTRIRMVKRVSPLINYATSFVLDFNNAPEREGIYGGVVYPDERVLGSSLFTYVNSDGIQFERCYLEDEPVAATPEFGRINVYNTINGVKNLLRSEIGNICYVSSGKGPAGRITLNNFKVSSYDNYIQIFLVPNEKDIIANKNMILMLDSPDITVNIIETFK